MGFRHYRCKRQNIPGSLRCQSSLGEPPMMEIGPCTPTTVLLTPASTKTPGVGSSARTWERRSRSPISSAFRISPNCPLLTHSSASTSSSPTVTGLDGHRHLHPGLPAPALALGLFHPQKAESIWQHLSQGLSFLCPQPSTASTCLRVKAQGLPEAHQVLHDLPHPLPALPSSFSPLPPSAPAAWPPCCSSNTPSVVQSYPRAFAWAIPGFNIG